MKNKTAKKVSKNKPIKPIKKDNLPVGRPTVMTEDVLQKLDAYFLDGLSDEDACERAGISASTLYSYEQENLNFRSKKAYLKGDIKRRAKKVLVSLLYSEDDKIALATAKDLLDRYEGKAKDKVEHSGGLSLETAETKALEVRELLHALYKDRKRE